MKRCLSSQLGDRLRLSKKPAIGEVSYNTSKNERITKIEDSIFVDSRGPHTDKTLNQIKSSTQFPLQVYHERSKSPVFGGAIAAKNKRSVSAPRQPEEIKYKYVRYEAAGADHSTSQKPNNVTMPAYERALKENRHDLKLVARFEVDRANRKVERAANQKLHESKKQRQNFSILN